jgi:reactive intermediate/imine deaminase
MTRTILSTPDAPAAIGTYSQGVRVGNTVYVSGQIPLDPATMQLVSGDIDAEIRRVFDNLAAVARAAGGTLNDAVKVTVFLTDLSHFGRVNEIMATYFQQPYPARAAVGVAALPRGARVEMECILSL